MRKAEIEQLVSARIRKAVETTAAECVREVNAAGHSFVDIKGGVLQWADDATGQVLEVTCALGVGIRRPTAEVQVEDPVTAAFVALAESGSSRVATVLNLLEGDIANGGFSQLFDNKGLAFVREAIGYLQDIGARSAERLVREALTLVEDRAAVIENYDRLQKELRRLDVRFGRLKANIPELYARWSAEA